ncbi:MAG: hypothetical protein ACKOSS_01755 [Planctomycetia bacterium]
MCGAARAAAGAPCEACGARGGWASAVWGAVPGVLLGLGLALLLLGLLASYRPGHADEQARGLLVATALAALGMAWKVRRRLGVEAWRSPVVAACVLALAACALGWASALLGWATR